MLQRRSCLKYNGALAAEYVRYCRQLSEQFGIPDDLTATRLARMPEVLTMEEEPEDEDQDVEECPAMEEAAKQFVESRKQGGRKTEGGSAGQAGLYG